MNVMLMNNMVMFGVNLFDMCNFVGCMHVELCGATIHMVGYLCMLSLVELYCWIYCCFNCKAVTANQQRKADWHISRVQ